MAMPRHCRRISPLAATPPCGRGYGHLSGSAERDILPDDRGMATLANWLTESGPDSPAGL